ncbi:4Fe-4S dicluster domain-containing protein [Methanosphaera cuniculi]|uniref:4Fe-4S dicluster domain-containing protein n=1 Tax=Methanosphaera cuniculi TaxID=1077256 RepID=UPI0026DDC568|nr:4Fe-4S dicluster domain-containing protein [Methanosphaera cuniculi]
MSLGKIFIEGIYVNLKRLIFGSECRTDLQLREDALNGNIKPSPKVAKVECIGCGGCATVCPTQAIVMNPVEPVEIIPGIMKTAIPEINEIECVHCYQCHDFCPIYALFGVAATIHPNDVGTKCDKDINSMLLDPAEVSDKKMKELAEYLTDDSILLKRKEAQAAKDAQITENEENVAEKAAEEQ